MKKKVRIALIISTVVFAIALFMTILKFDDYKKGSTIYSEARNIAGVQADSISSPKAENNSAKDKHISEDDNTHHSIFPDTNALQRVNSDVIGWISIPDTAISYPIVQGQDNAFYLKNTWDKNGSMVGSIFMECMCSPDFSDFNTIIYGHRMKDGSMFASLRHYSENEYLNSHPSIYITHSGSTFRYDIFSAYEANVRDITFGISLVQAEHKERLIAHALKNSAIDTDIIPTSADKILTLSTCTARSSKNTRWVVHAVLKSSVS